MAWRNAQSTIRPEAIDTTSSKKYNYIRKNITEETIEQEGQTVTVYNYLEDQILKEDWSLYESLVDSETRIGEVEDAVIELAGIIGGE